MLPSIGQPIEGTSLIMIMTRRLNYGRGKAHSKQCAYTNADCANCYTVCVHTLCIQACVAIQGHCS